jgi:hypothetical protein
MKTTVKVLIAAAITSVAATFSTGASAESLFELHQQHMAQLHHFLFGHGGPNVAINIGPAYQPAPYYQAPVYAAPPVAYVEPYGSYYGGPRGYARHERFDRFDGHRNFDRRDGRDFHR